MKKVGIRDVAAHAGVSTATVSHVLNKTRHVNEATVDKVMNSVRALNYSPNEIARSFKTGKKKLIGCVIPDVSNEYWSAIIKSISNYINKYNYRLVIANTLEEEANELDQLTALSHSFVDGIVLASTLTDYNKIIKCIPDGFPLITFDRTVADNPFSSITVSHYDSLYTGISNLIDNGHKRIAYINGFSRFSTMQERFAAYEDCLRNHGIALDDSIIFHSKKITDSAYFLIERFIDSGCTAFIASSGVFTKDILLFLLEHNCFKSNAYALLGYDEGQSNSIVINYMSYISQPISTLGNTLGKQIIEMIDNPSIGKKQTILETTFTPKS